MSAVKIIALDAEDLGIVSAHLQDAVVKIGELAYLPRDRRFAALLNRYDWAGEHSRRLRHRKLRRRSAVRFERVTAARIRGIDLNAKAAVLSLLAVTFQPGPIAPAGTVVLTFAGGGQIALEVECIEAELRDLGGAWTARRRPDHGSDDTGRGGEGAGGTGPARS